MRLLSTRFLAFILLLSAVIASCQKDESVKAANTEKVQLKTDSANKLTTPSIPGNFLAVKGTLQIKVQDSTYTFNASEDSVAFVNMEIEGIQFYGVTAINKAHTVSFGISSLGAPIAEMATDVAGCQFLLNGPGKSNLQYTLTRNAQPQDYGSISIEKFNQDTVLAKGTFHTFLAKDVKPNSPSYVADGTFELKLK